MRVFSVLILYLLSYLYILGTQSASILPKSVEDYYWRDYNGLLPSGALPGGTDENGATTYLAQFTTVAEYNMHNARLHTIPAVIKPGSKYAVGAYVGRALSSNDTTNTKILCYGSYATKYKWYSPGGVFPPSCRFVIGGYEDALPMYIGRAKHNKEVVVGKIFSDNTHHRAGLISPYNGGEIHHDVYEVLTFCA